MTEVTSALIGNRFPLAYALILGPFREHPGRTVLAL